MTKDDVIAYFGSPSAAAKALGIDPAAVSQWGDAPPPLRQYQIQVMTEGALVAVQREPTFCENE